jgi:hypothetical protein
VSGPLHGQSAKFAANGSDGDYTPPTIVTITVQ